MIAYPKSCTQSPWCDEDVCRCEEWAEEEEKEKENGKIETGRQP